MQSGESKFLLKIEREFLKKNLRIDRQKSTTMNTANRDNGIKIESLKIHKK